MNPVVVTRQTSLIWGIQSGALTEGNSKSGKRWGRNERANAGKCKPEMLVTKQNKKSERGRTRGEARGVQRRTPPHSIEHRSRGKKTKMKQKNIYHLLVSFIYPIGR